MSRRVKTETDDLSIAVDAMRSLVCSLLFFRRPFNQFTRLEPTLEANEQASKQVTSGEGGR